MKSPLSGWKGGKSKLYKQIEPQIPEHDCYCEPFAGAAWVLFRKDPALSRSEVINDINGDLVSFFRVVKYHLKALVEELEWILSSRSEFQKQKDLDPEHLTDVQRSARFFYLLKAGFGGRIVKPTYGYATTKRPMFNLARLQDDLLQAHWRLADVFIENLPFADVIARYDRQGQQDGLQGTLHQELLAPINAPAPTRVAKDKPAPKTRRLAFSIYVGRILN